MSYDIEGRWRLHHHDGGRPGRPGRWGHGRHGLHRARKLTSADLQLIILSLLEGRDAHGYELIKSLEERSNGYYAPSPGMIYPALTYLEEIGYAEVEAQGAKKLYRLTDAGRERLFVERGQAELILGELEQVGARMEEARRAFAGEHGPDEEPGQSMELREARRELKDLMRAYRSSDRDARVIQALRQASAQIKGEAVKVDPEALLSLIASRRSMGLSRLKPDPVERRLIERMLEAANWAPSHGDTEPWRFSVFAGEGREALAKIFEGVDRERAAKGEEVKDHGGARKRAFAAPVWISIGMSPGLNEDGTLLMSEEEELMAVACAVQNLHLMATAQGLIGMWHSKGISVHPAVARGLGLEPPARLLGFFMLGWPATEPPAGERRPLSEKVTWSV